MNKIITMKENQTMNSIINNRKPYEKPDVERVCGTQYLLDSFPVHWSEENEGEIESNQYSIFDEADSSDASASTSLWGDSLNAK